MNLVDKITNFYYTKIALQKYSYLYKTAGMKKIPEIRRKKFLFLIKEKHLREVTA
jgi:hypothetical protein